MKRETYVEFNDFQKPITGSFLTNEQAEQFKNAFNDFVQVIRCKDCRKNCTDNCLLYWNDINTPDNWYCADGERKPE